MDSTSTPQKSTPSSSKLKTGGMNETSMSQMNGSGEDQTRRLKEMEKRVTKLRNEN